MTQQESVYTALRADIVSGRFGRSAFLSENGVAALYGVGKAPVREALRRLCADGLLVSYPRKGFLLQTVSRRELETALRLRAACETELASLLLAAPEGERRALSRLADAPFSPVGNTDFHRALMALAHARAATDAHGRLLATIEMGLAGKAPPDAPSPHSAIADALARGAREALLHALFRDAQAESRM